MASLAQARNGFTQLPRVLALVWRASRGGALGLGALTLVGAGLPLGIAWIGKRLVDSVVAHDPTATLRFVLVELALVSLSAICQRGQQWLQGRIGGLLVIDIHVLILEKALRLDLAHFENHEFYDQLMRARSEASSRPLSVLAESLRLVQSTLTLLGFVGLLLRFSPWAVVALLLSAVPATLVEMRFAGAAWKLRNWRSPDRRRLNYVEYVLANDGHVKEVKLLGLGARMLARYRRLARGFYDEEQALSTRRALWGWLLSLVGSAAFYGCYGVAALQAARGQLSLGNLTLYIAAFRDGQQAFQRILGALNDMYEDSLYLGNLFAYLAIPTAARQAPSPAPAVVASERGIRFDKVGFRYPFPEDSRWVFRGLDLFIPAGQSLAIVGKNGAGKTTLIKLLTGLYPPTEGRVLLDGRDVRAWDETALRARVSAVFQDFNRYQFSVRDNVAVGSVEHEGDEVRLSRAIDKGGAAEVVGGLPAGLDTQLGTWFKGGSELSGGQWQKLALARAFMREEADILILDEPTAALDATTEHAVFERFRKLAEGRTTILISHRFPTVRMAERIVVLDDGRIIEDGSHDELVARGAAYAELFALQAAGYR